MSTPESWQIRNDPLGALDNWPDLAAEFDASWTDEPNQTFGEALERAQMLASKILEREGILAPRLAVFGGH
jgi:hypothetical protein